MRTNVAIIGLGLIGGSLGLALKRNPNVHVTGFDQSYRTMEEAYRRGIIDTIAPPLKKPAEACRFYHLCHTCEYNDCYDAGSATWKLKEDVIITDTGSTKGPIMEAAALLIEHRNYVHWRPSNGGFP